MFTVCPKCALTLVVTAADLRVAQGYVRCGRCSSVFNALARLTDERQAAALEQTPAPAAEEPLQEPANPTPRSVPARDKDDDLTDDALEFDPTRTDAADVFVQPPPNPQWAAATGSFKALIAGQEAAAEPAPRSEPSSEPAGSSQVDVEIDTDFLASMLQESSEAAGGSTPVRQTTATDPPAPPAVPAETPAPVRRSAARGARAAPAAPSAPATRPAARAAPSATPGAAARAAPKGTQAKPPVRHSTPHTRPPQAALRTPAAPSPVRTPPESTPTTQSARQPDDFATASSEQTEDGAAPAADQASGYLPPWLQAHAWTIGAILAALLLVVQIINHHRDELAASAHFNRPLTALYSALGVQLTPHWDLHAYDVRQLGATVDPGASGLITVKASIKNSAPVAQPLPLLRVTLQDRFGNRIAARDVAPRFYLPHSMPASSFLSGGQRIDAEMGFVDPGANAVGFEIDACLPASGGGVACANDTSAR
jgi:predicted Zn finger-like uncharacterized protein